MFVTCSLRFVVFFISSLFFFFFKQKTAYEMRISDWSSDVCSSDLHGRGLAEATGVEADVAFATVGYMLTMKPLDAHIRTANPYMTGRSEERRVGKECVSKCRSRWSPYHSKKKQMII